MAQLGAKHQPVCFMHLHVLKNEYCFYFCTPFLIPCFVVPYRNFVTSVNTEYNPLIFKNNKELSTLLSNQILINQSHRTLSDQQIEVLCLGLNFIPQQTMAKQSDLSESLLKLTRDIDTAIILSNKKGNRKLKGWLSKHIQSEWKPEELSWRSDPEIKTLLNNILNFEAGTISSSQKDISPIIQEIKQWRDVHILKSDKGRNTVIWQVTDYDKEALRQLNDKTTYKELSKQEFDAQLLLIKNKCQTISESLLALDYISPAEDEAICKRPPTGSAIYFLPKIHKNQQPITKTYPGRPIVATYTSVTYLLDKYITEITGILLKKIPGSLVDTQDFIKQLPSSDLPSGTKLITADVTSLYPNIPWDEGIEATVSFYSENFQILKDYCFKTRMRKPPLPRVFREILTLILSNSMIHFKERRFFHQITGTAMGCCISVFFANCYMYSVTRSIILSPPSWLVSFLRFIDDLFFITTVYDQTIFDEMITGISNDSIKYEVCAPAEEQNFLDTTVKIRNNGLVIQPFTKETASGAYLHPCSNHPHHTIRATPYSQFLRIRRISSHLYIFNKHAYKMKMDFIRMGYSKKLLNTTFRKVAKIKKEDLLLKTEKPPIAGSFKFITRFNQLYDWKALRNLLDELHTTIIKHYCSAPNSNIGIMQTIENKPIHLIFCNNQNLQSHYSGFLKKSEN